VLSGDILAEGREESITHGAILASGAIIDNDDSKISVYAADGNEADGQVLMPLTMTARVDEAITLTYTVTYRTASAADFPTEPTRGVYTYTITETNVDIANLPVPVVNDDLLEGDESFSVTLTNAVTASGRSVSVSSTSALATILDDEAANFEIIVGGRTTQFPEVTGEDGTVANFDIALSSEPTQSVMVKVTAVAGTGEAEIDFRAISETLVFPAGTRVLSVSVPIIQDFRFEADETFSVVAEVLPTTSTSGISLSSVLSARTEGDVFSQRVTILSADTANAIPTALPECVESAANTALDTAATECVDLSGCFVDPDGLNSALTYVVSSNSPFASITGSLLCMSPAEVGEYTLRVEAFDTMSYSDALVYTISVTERTKSTANFVLDGMPFSTLAEGLEGEIPIILPEGFTGTACAVAEASLSGLSYSCSVDAAEGVWILSYARSAAFHGTVSMCLDDITCLSVVFRTKPTLSEVGEKAAFVGESGTQSFNVLSSAPGGATLTVTSSNTRSLEVSMVGTQLTWACKANSGDFTVIVTVTATDAYGHTSQEGEWFCI
jgi:hypothetical protein